MLTYNFNGKAAAAFTVALAIGVLTIGSLVYAAGGNDAPAETSTSAAMPVVPADSQSKIVTSLLRAADEGNIRAMWRLAHLYKDGREVESNRLLAFNYFSRIADQNAEVDPQSADGRFVADSFVNLAALHHDGIEGSEVIPNEFQAARLLTYAATYFADPVAQYRLAIMYMEGRGVMQNSRRAVNWLMLAARKNYISAQCMLGRILFNGSADGNDGVPAIRSAGLMWLEIAKRYADPDSQAWIVAEHSNNFALATAEEISVAAQLADRWLAENAQTH